MAGFHKREEIQNILEENMIAEFLLQQAEFPIQKLPSMQMIMLDELTALLDTDWNCESVLNLCKYLILGLPINLTKILSLLAP